jgi:hypothetical protein
VGVSMALQKWSRRIAFCLATILLTISGYFSQSNAQSTADQSLSARAVNADGVIEILHEDLTNNSSRYLYFLKTADGRRVRLRFAKHPPTNLLTGDHVSVHGSQSGASMMLASGGIVTSFAKTQPSPPAGPLPNTFGAQSTLVILVNFQDAPTNQPYTVADAQGVVFGTASSFFLENSYQQTWLTGEVVGWYTIPLSSTTCNITSIASYAQAAASAGGVNLSAYSHYVYAFPQNNVCGFGGSSNIGGNPSQSWINGTKAAVVWIFIYSTTNWGMHLASGIPICSIAEPLPQLDRTARLLSMATSWTRWVFHRRRPRTTTLSRRSGWAG